MEAYVMPNTVFDLDPCYCIVRHYHHHHYHNHYIFIVNNNNNQIKLSILI